MENPPFVNREYICIPGPFSIAMLVYQRVYRKDWGRPGFGGRRPPQDLPRQNGKILGRRPRLPMLFLVFRGYMVTKGMNSYSVNLVDSFGKCG